MQDMICHYQYWFEGMRQPRDPGMPERSWGCYLPGDEPGWMCGLLEDSCNESRCPLEQEVEHEDVD